MSKTNDSKAKKSDKKKADKKPKRISGQNSGPQGFLPEHGEKLGFGLFGLVVLLCLWGALGHESYTKTPADLTGVLQQRRTAVQQNKPEDSPLLVGLEGKNYGELATESVKPVDWVDRAPPPGTKNDTPIILKRGEPELYPAIEGKAHTGFYPVAFQDPDRKKAKAPGKAAGAAKAKDDKKKDDGLFGGLLAPGVGDAKPKKKPRDKAPAAVVDAGPVMAAAPVASGPVKGVRVDPDMPYRGQRMVMLTWRVPRAKQIEAFRRVFENAREYQYDRDTANYISFWIQRKTDDKDWESTVTIETPRGGPKEVSLIEAYFETKKYFPLEFPEVVDTAQEDCIVPFQLIDNKDDKDAKGSAKIHDGFTAPLPPILGDDFDERAAGGFPMLERSAEPGFPGATGTQPGGAVPGGAVPGGVRPGAKQPGGVPPTGPAGLKAGPGALLPGGAGPGVGPGAPGIGAPVPGIGQPADGIKRGASGQRSGRKKAGPGGGAWSGGGAKMIGGRPAGEFGGGGPRTTGNAGGPGERMIGGRPAGEVGSGAGPRTTGNSGGNQKMVGGRPANEVGSGGGPRTTGNSSGGSGASPWDQKPNQGGSAVAAQPIQVAPQADILLRFFDFTVEEGHTYQYRVFVVLKNPNYKLPANLLKDPAYANEKVLQTAYSEPTEPVRVTIGGGEVVAGPVRGARPEGGYADSATAIFRQRNRTTGALLAYTFNRVEAGQVLNFNVKDSTSRGIRFETPVGGIDSAPEFAFQSDNLVLDLRGGQERSSDRGQPGEMLLLDASGRLIVQSEVGASPNFADESKRLEDVYNR